MQINTMSFNRFRYMTPLEIHRSVISDYVQNKQKIRRDIDVVRENHRFLWSECDTVDTWERQLAKKYYDKLFKEYCICDLTRYKDNKIALRWRTEKEVVTGRGHFSCANKHCLFKDCNKLKTWEVNFCYVEDNESKNALVKIRLCPDCSIKLNYKTQKRQIKRLKKSQKKNRVSTNDNEQSVDNCKSIEDKNESIVNVADDPNKIWEQYSGDDVEKSREDVFEDYLNDLLF